MPWGASEKGADMRRKLVLAPRPRASPQRISRADGFDGARSRRYAAKDMNRLAILVALALTAGLVAGCGSGPYTGKPEKLKKPRAKKRPAGDKAATEVTDEIKPTEMSNEQCRTKDRKSGV